METIFEGYRRTVGEYVATAWGWDESFQRGGFWENHPLKEFETVEIENEFAGGLHVAEDEVDIYIRMIFLLPKFQGRGIGSALIEDIHATARNRKKGLCLKVINCNPAFALYERLVFKIVNESDSSKNMRWA
ncbi:MAG: GNAT family N-acetyltransferase [Thiobacillus sp.]